MGFIDLHGGIEGHENFFHLAEQGSDGALIAVNQLSVWCNQNIAQIFGHDTPEETLNQPIDFFIAPDYAPFIKERYDRRLKGEKIPTRYETKGIKKSGKEFDIEVTSQQIRFKGKDAFLVSIRDLSHSKQSQQTLLESYQHLGVVNRQMQILSEIAQISQEEKPPDEIAHFILQSFKNILHLKDIALYRYDPFNEKFRLIFSLETSEEKLPEFFSIQESTEIQRMMDQRKKIKGQNTLLGKHCFLPLLSGKKTRGLILSQWGDNTPNRQDPFCEVFANQAANALSPFW